MSLRKEFRQRLAKEYRYAVTKMQEVKPLPKKLFYFSVFSSEAQRVLNWEWDRNLALIHMITHQVHIQVNTTMQTPGLGQVLPVDWAMICDKLVLIGSDLAAYFEKTENEGNREELYQILGRLAEIAYVSGGPGSYLHDKGIIKL